VIEHKYNIDIREKMRNKKSSLRKKKVVAVIACRIKSNRLFAKPLQPINDKTILDYIITQLRRCKLLDDIILAVSDGTGNEIFVEYAKEKKLKFTRGSEYDVLQRIIDAADYVNANNVFRVTSEDPFKYWQIIDKAIKQHIQTQADLTFTQKLPEGMGFEIINLKSLKTAHEKGTKDDLEDICSFIYKNHKHFKIKPFLVKEIYRRPEIRLTVDNPEDLILVRIIASKLLKGNKLPNLEEIINLLDKNSYLKKINNKFANPHRRWL